LEDGITPGQFKVRFKPSGPTGPIIIYGIIYITNQVRREVANAAPL